MKSSKAAIWVIAAVVIGGLAFVLTRPAGGTVKEIGNEELRELVSGGARLVDVRSPGEFAMGHIEGAELVPPEQVASVAAGWDRDAPVVVYCATGARSAAARDTLASMGFKAVYNHSAGLTGWDGTLTTDGSASREGVIKTEDKPVMVEFTSDG